MELVCFIDCVARGKTPLLVRASKRAKEREWHFELPLRLLASFVVVLISEFYPPILLIPILPPGGGFAGDLNLVEDAGSLLH